jgi:hypothetical protein
LYRRGRYWNAEYWISALRDLALSLACRRRGIRSQYGKGFDDLPTDVRERFRSALVAAFDREELLRALNVAVRGLLAKVDDVRDLAIAVAPQLHLLIDWK